MKGSIFSGLSVLAILVASVPAAEAFTSVTNSGLTGTNYMNHFISLEVDKHNLTGLSITLPEQIRGLNEVQIFNQAGEMIAANTTISDGLKLTLLIYTGQLSPVSSRSIALESR